MKALWRSASVLQVYCLTASGLFAGGSGLNVVVVVNQNSSNSVALGNYYCEKRQVPPQQLLRINWTGGNAAWNYSDFTNVLLNPLLAEVSSQQLTNQIDYVVLSMDIPYRVVQGGDVTTSGANSTTAVLYYGFKPDGPGAISGYPSCNLPDASSNSYAGSESVFRSSPPLTAITNSFLAMMITSSNLAQAEAIVDRGLASDGKYPVQPVVLAKTIDGFRNIRYLAFDNAIFNTRLRGNYSMFRTNLDSPILLTNLLGFETGLAQFSILPNAFIPGSFADSLTSTAGILYEPNNQTTLLAFLNSGATGSYGTIIEPCAYFEKFPSPQTYFYQARGFSLAECYYLGVTNPFQGLLVGEPLAAPFAQPANGSWLGLATNSVLAGTTNVSVEFLAVDAAHPVQQVDLFVDGIWAQTLTNVSPSSGNVITVNLNGYIANYTVPNGASIQTIVSGLAASLNLPATTNTPGIVASAHGDRIELHSLDPARLGSSIPVSVTTSQGTAAALTTFASASQPQFLDTLAHGDRGFAISGNPLIDTYLQCVITKPNSTPISLAVTNTSGSSTLTQMTGDLLNLINATPALQGADGLTAEDFLVDYAGPVPPEIVEFYLVANSPGLQAAQVQVNLSGSLIFQIQPVASGQLDMNLSDLQPRNHLYVTAGVTNLPVTLSLDTTAIANGFHVLTAVGYEGSDIRTQTRVSQTVRIDNNPLSAVFSSGALGTNVALGGNLEFTVTANTNNIASVRLYSTGGSLAVVSNQTAASFSVPATTLGVGLHPFYAVVTSNDGSQYQTEILWLRIVESLPSLSLAITTPPPTLSWNALVGHSYDVLATTNLANPFQVIATVTPTNSPTQWTDTNPMVSQRFYQVRSSN